MGKDPAFLFYPGDWDSGTKLFSRHEKGAYMDLLICQFHCGHMTSHDIGHVLGQNDYAMLWDSKLKYKFIQDSEGKFFNKRLEEEQLKRKNWCNSRRNNKDGHNQYSGHMTKHMTGHMENKNKDENKNTNTNNTLLDINTNNINNKLIESQTKSFNILWQKYPRRLGRKQAFKHYCASVKNKEDYDKIYKALNNYLNEIETKDIKEQFIKHGSSWFNNWQDYIEIGEIERWNKL